MILASQTPSTKLVSDIPGKQEMIPMDKINTWKTCGQQSFFLICDLIKGEFMIH